jgi:hypothetical protein
MRLSQLAERRALALERVLKASNLDLSESAFPKSPDLAHREMHILEAVAAHLEAQDEERKALAKAAKATAKSGDVEAILERIGKVKGVGPATMDAIREAIEGE